MMVSQKRLFSLMTLLLLAALVLVACERPFASNNDATQNNQTQTNESANETANTAPNSGVNETGSEVDEEAGGGVAPDTSSGAEEQPEAYPAPSGEEEAGEETADTPRVEPEEEATPTPEPVPTEEADTSEEAAAAADEETTNEAEQPAAEQAEDTAETTSETPEAETISDTSTHTVAAGENLYRIGLQYGISWVTLAEINGLANPNDIKVGQVLQLSEATTPTVEPTPSPLTETTYTVQIGDNLYKIGLAYGITWVQIAEANGIVNPNQILVGQVLKIPVEAPGPAPQFTHTVLPGETLYLISLQYGIAWPAIAELNSLESPYVIYAGQTLVIPGSG